MDERQRSQSALLDAIYGAAITPRDYLEFARVWDDTILKLTEDDIGSSLHEQAEALDLRKHFNRAFDVFEKARLGKQQSLQSFLDNQIYGAAICESNGRIVACNPSFRGQLDLGADDSLSSLEGQVVPLLSGRSNPTDGHWLKPNDHRTAFRHYHKDGKHRVLVVERFDQANLLSAKTSGPLILVRSTELEWSGEVDTFLKSRFGLTEAESQIARSLLAGKRSDEIAACRGSKRSTVRQQIKSVMDKTQTSTQAMLVAMLASLHHLFGTRKRQEIKRTTHIGRKELIHETYVEETPHWGTIEFELYGKPGGDPIFFLHSQMSSARPSKAMINAMADAGLLIFAPKKPGLAQTSLEQLETDPKGFVTAFITMMEAKGVRFSALVGQGMSGVAMVDWGAENSSFSGSLVTIDSGIPFTRREQFEHMPPVSKRIFWTVWDCPELFYAPFAFASEALFASEEAETAFMEDQFKDIVHDFELIEDPYFYELARIAMRDFMSTPKRSADELVYWMQDWTPQLKQVAKTGRLSILQSEHHDFLRFDDAEGYFEQIPNVRTVLLEDCAQLCFFEKPHLIAAEIVSSIARTGNHNDADLLGLGE